MKTKITYLVLSAVFLTIFSSLILANARFSNSNETTLNYHEYGVKNGSPVLYFHGFPGSHLDIQLFTDEAQLKELNIRLIAVNRPGYSDSEGVEGRTLKDWSTKVEELADHLGLKKFSILAYSGGAPFAYACCYFIPERLNKVIIVSGMTTPDAPQAKKGSAMMIPKAPKIILKGMMKMLQTKPEKFEASMRRGFPEVDQLIYDISKIKSTMMNTILEGMKNGYKGAYQDAIIYKNEWGFMLSGIDHPINLYHGTMDQNVKIESAKYMIDLLPNCKSKIYPEEGHLSLIYNHSDDILKSLSSD